MTRRRALSNLALIGAFGASCVLGLGYLAVNMGLQVPGLERGWHLSADFQAAENLVPQADVDLAGVRVGKVVSVQADGSGGASVLMLINPGVRLRQDIRAYVRPKSVIGEQCVELVRTPGSRAPWAKEGFHIPRDRTGQAVQIDDILNRMDPQTRAALSRTLRELGVAVEGRSGDVNASIPYIEQTAANLRPLAQIADRRQRQIDRILVDLAIIMRALADEEEALGRVVDSGDAAMGAIASRDRQLAGTVQQADHLLLTLDQTFSDLTPADRASLEKAPPTISSGRQLLGTLGPQVDRLLPELLLAQVNYPNDQLSVSHPEAVELAYEWLSAFSQRDQQGHAQRITNITTVQPPLGGPLPQSPASNGSAAPTAPTVMGATVGPSAPPAAVQLLLGLGL